MHIAKFGVAPAQQGLDSHDLGAFNVDLRLVMQPEPSGDQRLTHRVVELHARTRLRRGHTVAQVVQPIVTAA